MSAVLPPIAAPAAAARAEGVWRAAWRRLRHDRVGMASLSIVLLFVLLIVLAATGLVARDWQKEVAVASAPPTFMGPAPPAAAGPLAAPAGPPVDISAVDPLAPYYAKWAERAAQYKTVDVPRAATLTFGADRLGRDVLAKALKGTQTSVFVGLLAAIVA
ncbi:MAG: ABC transporter permease, partial [Caldimonas sp.]